MTYSTHTPDFLTPTLERTSAILTTRQLFQTLQIPHFTTQPPHHHLPNPHRHPLQTTKLTLLPRPRAYYSTMVLLCIHRDPRLSAIPNPHITTAIRKGHEFLRIWAANPGVANSVHHVELGMVRCGLLSSASASTPASASASASVSASVYRAPGGADGDAPSFSPVATATATATLGQARLRMGLEIVMEGGGGV